MSTQFKLCILAAGLGTRNTFYTNLHKGLLPINNRPAISYIINNTPKDVEIVVAVGYKAEQLKSYLSFVFPERKITYIHIDPYEGPKSGPGVSLLQCKDHLNCPFIFTSVDTILDEKVEHTAPFFDWIGVDKEDNITYACVINKKLERVSVPPIYIGIAGISDWKGYFSRLEASHSCEVTDGFNNPKLVTFNWIDTGSNASYSLLTPSSIVPPKNDQIIFIDNKKVVKFYSDPSCAERVYQRAIALKANVTKVNEFMVGYDYIPGKLLSDLSDKQEYYTYLVLDKILTSGVAKPANFSDLCSEMYEIKTRRRVASLKHKFPELDNIEFINSVRVKPIDFYLENIPWNYINSSSVASDKFHGDVQPENIIIGEASVDFIDWRDSFAGNIHLGDMYYDLAKLWHGCLVSNRKVLEGAYSLSSFGDAAELSIEIIPFLASVLTTMKKYCDYHKLDWNKIEMLGALQFITIAALYDNQKYSKFLFLLGKLILEKLEDGTTEIIRLIQN